MFRNLIMNYGNITHINSKHLQYENFPLKAMQPQLKILERSVTGNIYTYQKLDMRNIGRNTNNQTKCLSTSVHNNSLSLL